MESDDLSAMVPLADQIDFAKYIIVGGGIAGVSCVEMLSTLCPNDRVLLISASPTVKAVTNISNLTKLISTFDIDEQSGEQLEARHRGVSGNYTCITKVLDQVFLNFTLIIYTETLKIFLTFMWTDSCYVAARRHCEKYRVRKESAYYYKWQTFFIRKIMPMSWCKAQTYCTSNAEGTISIHFGYSGYRISRKVSNQA